MKNIDWICIVFLYAQSIFASVAGDWHGVLNPGFAEITLVLHIESDSLGQLTAKIDTLEYELFNTPVEAIALESESLQFLLKGKAAASRLSLVQGSG